MNGIEEQEDEGIGFITQILMLCLLIGSLGSAYYFCPPAVFVSASTFTWVVLFFVLFFSIIIFFVLLIDILPIAFAPFIGSIYPWLVIGITIFGFSKYEEVGESARNYHLTEYGTYTEGIVLSSSKHYVRLGYYYAITATFIHNDEVYHCRFSGDRDAAIGENIKIKYSSQDPRINTYCESKSNYRE